MLQHAECGIVCCIKVLPNVFGSLVVVVKEYRGVWVEISQLCEAMLHLVVVLLRSGVHEGRKASEELLLGMGLPFASWRADAPLGDFEGVTVGGEDGLVVALNFEGKKDVAFKLADFAPLVSVKEINFKYCLKATGVCHAWGFRSGVVRKAGRVRRSGEERRGENEN